MVFYHVWLSNYAIRGKLPDYNLDIRQFFPDRIFDASIIAMQTRADAIDHRRISFNFGQFRTTIVGRYDTRQAFEYFPDLLFYVRSFYCITHIEQSFASLNILLEVLPKRNSSFLVIPLRPTTTVEHFSSLI